jgi:DNA polymerase
VTRRLAIDLETYSSVPIKLGIYKYVESPDFEILLFRYAYDDAPVQEVDCTDGWPPVSVLMDLTNRAVEKIAFNAQFERLCLTKYLGLWPNFLSPMHWTDTMILSVELGYPRDLDTLGQALGDDRYKKDKRGKALIQYFSKPCKPTIINGGRTRNMPDDAPDRWKTYGDYCTQDVETERGARIQLHRKGDLVPDEWTNWRVDQRINDRGFRVDMQLVNNIIKFRDDYQADIFSQIRRLTGIDNPSSPKQVQAWLTSRGIHMASIGKDYVKDEIGRLKAKDRTSNEDDVLKYLELRQKSALSSLAKYDKIKEIVERDGRVRGCFAFYGAQRTGRFAGRLVQIQNLPRSDAEFNAEGKRIFDLGYARECAREARWDDLRKYAADHGKDVLDYCKQLIRTAIIPSPGKKIVVADFSNIEARVIAWLAGEQWRIDVFKSGQGIYETSASQMFGVPVESITHGSPLRQKGKTAELALGYQGWVGAMRRMDAGGKIKPDDMSDVAVDRYIQKKQIGKLDVKKYLKDTKLPKYRLGHSWTEAIRYVAREKMIDDNYASIVKLWREKSPKIVEMWDDFETAAKQAIREHTRVYVGACGQVAFSFSKGILWMHLPSDRRLAYPDACIKSHTTNFGKTRQTIFYRGRNEDETTRRGFSKKWGELETYGGKLVENCVQAVARDLLTNALQTIELVDNPFRPIGHVHDEIITECSVMSTAGPDDLAAMMTVKPDWADSDLVLDAAGFESMYYKKE